MKLYHYFILTLKDVNPSEQDIAIAESLGIPSYIFLSKIKIVLYYPKSFKPRKLQDRIFIPFFQDCVAFVRDFYYLNFNINFNKLIKEWSRNRSNSSEKLINSITNHFYELDNLDLKYGDLILFKPEMSNLHHLGVMDKDNFVFHHPIGSKPHKNLFNDKLVNKVYKCYRYKFMKTFILHGDMADKFCKKIKLDVNTMEETISALSSQFNGFRKYYLTKLLSGVQFVFIDQFDLKYEQYCYHLPLKESTYHIMPSVEGSAGGNLLTFGLNLGLGFLMQKLVNATEVQDDGTPEYEIITTNSFIYSNNENRAEQGIPVPVVYGHLRVGSQLIHSSIHNYDYNYDDALIYEGFPKRTRLSKIASRWRLCFY